MEPAHATLPRRRRGMRPAAVGRLLWRGRLEDALCAWELGLQFFAVGSGPCVFHSSKPNSLMASASSMFRILVAFGCSAPWLSLARAAAARLGARPSRRRGGTGGGWAGRRSGGVDSGGPVSSIGTTGEARQVAPRRRAAERRIRQTSEAAASQTRWTASRSTAFTRGGIRVYTGLTVNPEVNLGLRTRPPLRYLTPFYFLSCGLSPPLASPLRYLRSAGPC